jgi:hypothetical protein
MVHPEDHYEAKKKFVHEVTIEMIVAVVFLSMYALLFFKLCQVVF